MVPTHSISGLRRFTALPWLVPVSTVAAALTAQAQQNPARASRPDPLDARARVPAVACRSSLMQGKPVADDKAAGCAGQPGRARADTA